LSGLNLRTNSVRDSAPMPCARRAAGGRRQGCDERQLACLCGTGGGQLRAPQFKNVLPAVKPAVDDNEGGVAHGCASCDCKPCSTRRGIAETQFQAAQLRAIEAALRLTADVRRQYWRTVAAQELVRFLNEARGSAELLEDRGERAGRWVGMVFLDLALWPHMTGLCISRARPLPQVSTSEPDHARHYRNYYSCS
jgi:hypothetical protein